MEPAIRGYRANSLIIDDPFYYVSNTDFPHPTQPEPQETAKQKRDRLSREHNRKMQEAIKRGGKFRY